MSDDLMKLYSERILALAAEIPHLGTLPAPQGQARRRSPLCGSTVTVGLRMRDGRVSDFAQDVKACALGQASAAIAGAVIPGRSRAELEAACKAVSDMLKAEGPAPAPPFDGYEVLLPARDYRNRHASILLVLEAAAEAAAMAEAAQTAAPPSAAE